MIASSGDFLTTAPKTRFRAQTLFLFCARLTIDGNLPPFSGFIPMRLKIQSQLLLPLVTLMLGLVGMSIWMALATAGRERRHIETQMDNVAATVRNVTFPRNQQILQLMKRMSGADFIICDANRRPVFEADRSPIATLPSVPEQLPVPDPTDEHSLGSQITVAGRIYFSRGVPLGTSNPANLTLYILYPESLWKDALWGALWPALFPGIVGGIISITLTVALTHRLTGRIQELDRRTRLIASGDFSPMPLPRRNDELRDLGQSVNDMAERLATFQDNARKMERLRLLDQVSAGLAHQLRNGVTGTRLAIQVHARECAGDNVESLTVALRQLTLLETHLKRFLDLGKTIELQPQRCEVGDLIRESVALLGPQCRHAGIDLLVPDDNALLAIWADAEQFGHLLLNILTNAIEAAGPGGKVEILLGETPNGNGFVDIVDSGRGPHPGIAERLFEPFITGKAEGVGLGLAVARHVAEAHGGSIHWFRESGKTRFRIEFPLTHRTALLESGVCS